MADLYIFYAILLIEINWAVPMYVYAEMTQEPTENILKDNIMSPIETGRVKMHPRWYFVIKAALYLVGIILGILFLLYLVSFIIFIFYQNNVWLLPGFGLRGIREFLVALPWVLIFLAILFVILLEILVKRYSFVYRRPLIYSTMGIIVLAVVGGEVITTNHFHKSLFVRAQQNRLPFAGGLYRYYVMPRKRNLIIGDVSAVLNNGYQIKSLNNDIFTATVVPKTRFPLGNIFAVGDKIIVFGKSEGNIIEAFEIRKMTER